MLSVIQKGARECQQGIIKHIIKGNKTQNRNTPNKGKGKGKGKHREKEEGKERRTEVDVHRLVNDQVANDQERIAESSKYSNCRMIKNPGFVTHSSQLEVICNCIICHQRLLEKCRCSRKRQWKRQGYIVIRCFTRYKSSSSYSFRLISFKSRVKNPK